MGTDKNNNENAMIPLIVEHPVIHYGRHPVTRKKYETHRVCDIHVDGQSIAEAVSFNHGQTWMITIRSPMKVLTVRGNRRSIRKKVIRFFQSIG